MIIDIMWLKSLKLSYKKLSAKTINLNKSENTPILFNTYNEDDYYYVINNNYNYIYSLDELCIILKNNGEKRDPFTRLPIVKYEFVRIKLVCE